MPIRQSLCAVYMIVQGISGQAGLAFNKANIHAPGLNLLFKFCIFHGR